MSDGSVSKFLADWTKALHKEPEDSHPYTINYNGEEYSIAEIAIVEQPARVIE